MRRTSVTLAVFVAVLISIAPIQTFPSQVQAMTTAAVPNHNPRPLPNGTNLPYYEYLPAGYGSGTLYPIVVFFHGIDECGNGTTELSRVLKLGPPKLIEGGKQFDAIVISPQLPPNSSGVCDNISWSTTITTPFVNAILNKYAVDRDRVYVTGLSLGGGGAWMYAKANPGVVAALVPVCGAGSSSTGFEVLRGMPLWAFHYEVDSRVPYSWTTSKLGVITGVNPEINRPTDNRTPGYTGAFNGTGWTWRLGQAAPPASENPILTTYEGSSHAAWTPAYNNQAMWDWMFSQRRPTSAVFQQDFQSSTSVAAYHTETNPNAGQFNNIGAEANGGTWSINQGRLQLVRTGSTADDNDAGITRHTDLAAAPAVLQVGFDLGVSGWTTSPFQSSAMILSIGKLIETRDYGLGEVSNDTFQTLRVNGKGGGQFAIATGTGESAPLAANGTLHRVELFLNKSATAASYKGPNGATSTVRAGGVALWVDGTLIVEEAASNGSASTLTDLRMRFSAGENATWTLDNVVVRNALPQ
ncbi:MAG: hypothetical protein JOZ51_24245 [Chloroflexi bacterium]|nr:hypothetical protein [Chloroflexota bacterium]